MSKTNESKKHTEKVVAVERSDKAGLVSVSQILRSFLLSYKSTESRVKLIDAFALFAITQAIVQVAYLLIAGSFPYNSFLSGFFCSVGQFVFMVNLRLLITQPADFDNYPVNLAFIHAVFGSVVLYFIVLSFMG